MSLLSEVYKDVTEMNNIKMEDSKGSRDISAPKYDPNIPIGPPQPVVSSHDDKYAPDPSARSSSIRNTGNEQLHPSINIDPKELEELRKHFMWVMKQSPEIENKYSGDIGAVLNNPQLMTNIIEEFDRYVKEQALYAEQEQTQRMNNRKDEEEHLTSYNEDPEDEETPANPSLWVGLFNEIKLPLVMAIIYYLLGMKNVQLYLNDLLPMLSDYYNFKLVLMSLLFFIVAIIIQKLLLWIEN